MRLYLTTLYGVFLLTSCVSPQGGSTAADRQVPTWGQEATVEVSDEEDSTMTVRAAGPDALQRIHQPCPPQAVTATKRLRPSVEVGVAAERQQEPGSVRRPEFRAYGATRCR